MKKIHENMCFDVVFLFENIRTCLFTRVFIDHFYPPLHHNGKGSIEASLASEGLYLDILCACSIHKSNKVAAIRISITRCRCTQAQIVKSYKTTYVGT